MARTVIAVYESVYIAEKAVWELHDLGYPRDRIEMVVDSVRSRVTTSKKAEKVRSEVVENEIGAGLGIGAGIGASMGIAAALLFGLGTLHIPSIALAAGQFSMAAAALGAVLVGAVAGSGGGALLGGLLGLGIPEEEAQKYARSVRQDSVTVMVLADWDAIDGAIEVLTKHNPLELKEKTIEWQMHGRKGWKPVLQPVHIEAQEHHERR